MGRSTMAVSADPPAHGTHPTARRGSKSAPRWWGTVIVVVAAMLAATAQPAAAYPVPDPLPVGQPGEVISVEDLGPVPGGTRYRVIHHSRSVAGDDIAVSGLVFVPSTPAPPAGRPMVAWAHGTVGIADECAPSLGGYDPVYLDELLAAGYVVTATDYEGLGTPGRHPYLVGESEGRGVLDSLRAALLMPETSARNEAVIFGHSQGGHAALFANELAPMYAPELVVHGAVAAAPASQLMAAWSIATSGPVVRSSVVMMGAGFAQSYPALDLADVYTPVAIARMGVVDTGCQSDVVAAYADLTQDEMIAQLPDAVASWRAAVSASEPGYRVGAGPVLIVHGTEDEEVPYAATLSLSDRMCATGQVHDLVTYPGENHSGIFGPGRDTILSWIDARFAGTGATDRCADEPAPRAPAAGECAPSAVPLPHGLAAISGPAVADAQATPTAMPEPFTVTATPTIEPGGTITYTGAPSDALEDLATSLLETRVRPIIVEQYGTALANTAWVTMVLTDITITAPLPAGTTAEGTPSVRGSDPDVLARFGVEGLVIEIPSLTLDSRTPSSLSTTVTWSVRDGQTVPPATVSAFAGSVRFELELSIGVRFFGADLVGGMHAPFTCLPSTAPLAQTAVIGVAQPAPPAVAVAVTPALAG